MSITPTAIVENVDGAVVTLQGDTSLIGGSQADVDWKIGAPASGWKVGSVTT